MISEKNYWDIAEHSDTPERIALYIAAETGRSRESLYRVLSEKGNPQFDTLIGVLKAIGLRLGVQPIAGSEPA